MGIKGFSGSVARKNERSSGFDRGQLFAAPSFFFSLPLHSLPSVPPELRGVFPSLYFSVGPSPLFYLSAADPGGRSPPTHRRGFVNTPRDSKPAYPCSGAPSQFPPPFLPCTADLSIIQITCFKSDELNDILSYYRRLLFEIGLGYCPN